MKEYKVIGAMSGTSLDGLDLAYCHFTYHEQKWNYKIIAAETVEYESEWKNRLFKAPDISTVDLAALDFEFGRFIGKNVTNFIGLYELENPDFIASHGHTVFHQPEKGFTLQIGSGAAIAAASGITSICDFRSTDVALGGQGAPLVPVGDELLFGEYDFCLNLGGFANISFLYDVKRYAYDVCAVNTLLNYLAAKKGLSFDKNGELGKRGKQNETLLEKLNSLPYFLQNSPKSLGREWLEEEVLPLFENSGISIEDQIRTAYKHIALQIISAMMPRDFKKIKALVTGGGAYNSYLTDLLRKLSTDEFYIPDKQIIDFKEALIFAFLGVLRWRNEVNCLASVTGAKHDSVGGCVYLAGEI